MRTMRRPYQITGTFLFLFSAYIAKEAQDLKFYTSLGPGPGFFPFWLAVFFGLLSAAMVFQATFTRSDPMPDDWFASKTGYLRAGSVIVAMIWAVFSMERFGFRYTMAVFFLWLLSTLGEVGLIKKLLITLFGSWGTFWFFTDALKVPLPIGDYDEPWIILTNAVRAVFALVGIGG